LSSHVLYSEFLGITDLGDVETAAGQAKPAEAYVGDLPYGLRDFERTEFPGAVTPRVTALNNDGLVVGSHTDTNGDIAACTERKEKPVPHPG
jgi:hypothetical protein